MHRQNEREEWRPVPGFEGFYRVSNTGKVWSERRQKVLKPMRQGHKCRQYDVVHLFGGGKNKKWKVHILVLHVFVSPRPDGLLACHDDDDQFNNSVGNLYWGTHSDNGKDRAVRMAVGGQKITEAQRLEILRRRLAGESGNSLAREFGISPQRVCDIYKRSREVVYG